MTTMKFTVNCPLCSTESKHDSEPTGLLTCKKCKLEYMYNPNHNKKRSELTFSSDSEDDEILPNYKHQENKSSNSIDVNDDDESEFDQLTSEPSKFEFDFDQIKSDESEFELPPSDNEDDDWENSEPEQVEEEKVYKKRKVNDKKESFRKRQQVEKEKVNEKAKGNDREEQPRKQPQVIARSTSPIPNVKLPDFNLQINFDAESSEEEEESKPKRAPIKKDILFDSDGEEDDYDSTPTPSGSKRFKEVDGLFSDMDDDDEDDEEEEVTKKKKPKMRTKSSTLTRVQKVSLFNSLKKVDDDTTPLQDSETGKVFIHKSGGVVEKAGEASSSAGKKKATVPRVRFKRDHRKEEKEYVRGPYRYGSKALNKYNPYILFNTQHRAEIKKLNPGVPNKELTRIVSQAWNNLEPAKKEEYQQTAAKLREELAAKLQAGKEVDNTIKIPPNAYLIFQNRNKEKYKAEVKCSGEIVGWASLISTKWKNLPEEEKNKYHLEAQQLRDEYYEKYGDIHKQKMKLMVDKVQAKRNVTIAKKLQNKTPK